MELGRFDFLIPIFPYISRFEVNILYMGDGDMVGIVSRFIDEFFLQGVHINDICVSPQSPGESPSPVHSLVS